MGTLVARIVIAGATALLLLGVAGCDEPIGNANELEARIESLYDETALRGVEARCGLVTSETFSGGLEGIDAFEARLDYYACLIEDLETIVLVDGADWSVHKVRSCPTCRWRSPESLLPQGSSE